MTTHKEALKLAREGVEIHSPNSPEYIVCAALIEALAQPKRDLKPKCFADFQPNHEHERKCQWCAVETECKTGVAQPEQEPVAWMRKDETCTDCFVWERTDEHTIPLYITTPQRKPLNNQNPLLVFAKECVLGAYSETELADAAFRAIQAAHGIKE